MLLLIFVLLRNICIHNLIKYMSQGDDFRDGFNLKHKPVDILTIAVLAVLSGVETWDDMELYSKERLPLLKKFLVLLAGIPSHDTFNRVFSLLNLKSLETALQEWIISLVPSLPPDFIALDGKSIGEVISLRLTPLFTWFAPLLVALDFLSLKSRSTKNQTG